MNTYTIDGKTYIVHGGNLYLKLEAEHDEAFADVPKPKNKVGRPKGNSPKGIGRPRKSHEPLKLTVTPRHYICANGHAFVSKFPATHARCPDCKSLVAVDADDALTELD